MKAVFISSLLDFIELITGRSEFQERVFDYLDLSPRLQAGSQLMKMDLEAVRLARDFFETDVQTTFTLKEPDTEPQVSPSTSAKELAKHPPTEESSVTFRVDDNPGGVVGDQVFHFTFTSRLDFEMNLIELESMVETLFMSVEERRSLNNVFYDDLGRFLKSDENGVSSPEPQTLAATGLESQNGRERAALRSSLREALFYHHHLFRLTERIDRALGVLLVLLPAALGFWFLLRGVASNSSRIAITMISFGIALIATLRSFFDLPALAEEHRHFSDKYRELLRELERETRAPIPNRNLKKGRDQFAFRIARIASEANNLKLLAPQGFRWP